MRIESGLNSNSYQNRYVPGAAVAGDASNEAASTTSGRATGESASTFFEHAPVQPARVGTLDRRGPGNRPFSSAAQATIGTILAKAPGCRWSRLLTRIRSAGGLRRILNTMRRERSVGMMPRRPFFVLQWQVQ